MSIAKRAVNSAQLEKALIKVEEEMVQPMLCKALVDDSLNRKY
jgi:hypothetical protein